MECRRRRCRRPRLTPSAMTASARFRSTLKRRTLADHQGSGSAWSAGRRLAPGLRPTGCPVPAPASSGRRSTHSRRFWQRGAWTDEPPAGPSPSSPSERAARCPPRQKSVAWTWFAPSSPGRGSSWTMKPADRCTVSSSAARAPRSRSTLSSAKRPVPARTARVVTSRGIWTEAGPFATVAVIRQVPSARCCCQVAEKTPGPAETRSSRELPTSGFDGSTRIARRRHRR